MTSGNGAWIEPVLRHRNFALLWSGQTISVAGNGIFTVALPLEVLRITGSPLDLALVAGARVIPSLFLLLIGGALVDRLSRRRVMFLSDAICGLSLAGLSVLVVTHTERLSYILALALVLGAASAFFLPASTAIIRDILPPELLTTANSLSSLSQSLSQFLVGPLLGGAIVAAVGSSWAFGIDSASFAASAACLSAIRDITEVRSPGERITKGIGEGLRYCRSQPWLWWTMLALGVANFAYFAPSSVLAPLLVRNAFHGGPIAVAFMFSAIGCGSAIVSTLASRRKMPRRPVVSMWVAWIMAGIFAAITGFAPWLWAAIICSAISWGAVTFGNIVWMSVMQARTPAPLLGRVSSIDWLFSLALAPLGSVAAGAVVLAAGIRLTVFMGGIIAAATGIVLVIPRVADRPADPKPARRRLRHPRPVAEGRVKT